jgi:hypothetical protein
MRCQACDVELSDYESTRKHVTTGDYIDLCNRCYKPIKEDLPTIDRPDLDTTIENADNEVYIEDIENEAAEDEDNVEEFDYNEETEE